MSGALLSHSCLNLNLTNTTTARISWGTSTGRNWFRYSPGTLIVNFRNFRDKIGKIRFGDFWICGKCILGHFEFLNFSAKFWIFEFSTNFSYIDPDGPYDPYFLLCWPIYGPYDPYLLICWCLGGSRGLAGGRRGVAGGSPGGRRAVAPGAGNQFRLPP